MASSRGRWQWSWSFITQEEGTTPLKDNGGIMRHELMKMVLASPEHLDNEMYCEHLGMGQEDY